MGLRRLTAHLWPQSQASPFICESAERLTRAGTVISTDPETPAGSVPALRSGHHEAQAAAHPSPGRERSWGREPRWSLPPGGECPASPQQRPAGLGGCTHTCGFTPSSEGRPLGEPSQVGRGPGEGLAGCLSSSRAGSSEGPKGHRVRTKAGQVAQVHGRPATLQSGPTHSHLDCASGPLPLHTPTVDPDHREPAALGPKSKMRGGRGDSSGADGRAPVSPGCWLGVMLPPEAGASERSGQRGPGPPRPLRRPSAAQFINHGRLAVRRREVRAPRST